MKNDTIYEQYKSAQKTARKARYAAAKMGRKERACRMDEQLRETRFYGEVRADLQLQAQDGTAEVRRLERLVNAIGGPTAARLLSACIHTQAFLQRRGVDATGPWQGGTQYNGLTESRRAQSLEALGYVRRIVHHFCLISSEHVHSGWIYPLPYVTDNSGLPVTVAQAEVQRARRERALPPARLA